MTLPICLSANGDVVTSSGDPPLSLLVATADGLHLIERPAVGSKWRASRHMLAGTHPSSLIREPRSGLLFCGLHYSGGIHVSADNGQTWQPRATGLESGHVYMLAHQDIGGHTRLYAGTEPPMLYKSDDLGLSWSAIPSMWDVPDTDQWRFPPPPHLAHVKNIAFHPAQPRTLYICVEQGDLLKSADGGASWKSLTSYEKPDDQFRRDMHRVVIRPSDPLKLYLASGVGLYYSEDGGESFEHLTPGDYRVGYPDCLFLDPNNEATIFMAGASRAPNPKWRETGSADPGVLRSDDGGRNWRELTTGFPPAIRGNIEAMCAHEWRGNLSLFAGSSVGEIWASDDRGESWHLAVADIAPVSKGAHYRHFTSADKRDQIEAALKS